MKSFKLPTKIYSGICFLIAMGLLLGWMGVKAAGDLYASSINTKDSVFAPAKLMADVTIAQVRMTRAMYAHAFFSDPKLMGDMETDIETQSKVIDERTDALMAIEGLTQAEKDTVKVIRQELDTLRKLIPDLLAYSRALKTEKAQEVLNVARTQVLSIGAKQNEFIKTQEVQLKEASIKNQEQFNSVRTTSITLIVLMALAGLTVIFVLRGPMETFKRVIQQLDASSRQVAAASDQISSASQQLASSSTEQASSVEETSASLSEMAAMVENSLKNAESAQTIVGRVREGSEQGNESMIQLQNSMSEILASNTKIEQLVKVIEEIGEKTAIIDEIVFQTKLLSFNASVEAERAGEHGRGFAVVAQEVGNLAQMSGKAALEISGIVKSSIKEAHSISVENRDKVEKGSVLVEKTGEILKTILKNSDSVMEGSRQIVSASREQTSGIRQVNQAMDNINKATQESAATSEEAASAGEELSAQAAALDGLVRELTGIINGGAEPVNSFSGQNNSTAGGNVPTKANNASAKVLKFVRKEKPPVGQGSGENDAPKKVANGSGWEQL